MRVAAQIADCTSIKQLWRGDQRSELLATFLDSEKHCNEGPAVFT